MKAIKVIPILLAAIVVALTARAAYADAAGDAARLFELHGKLLPGMTIEQLNELLGPPAEEHAVGNGNLNGDLTRYAWLHGEMGVEVYEVDGAAYRVVITLNCGDNKGQLRALDALTKQGRTRYGSMPRSDSRKNEYYWERDGIRFAFSRYNKTTVLTSCTKAN